jgi:hypothetical protein
MLTPAVPSIEEPAYPLVAELSEENVAMFLKAKKAITADVFTIKQTYNEEQDPMMEFTLGGTEGYTNKINFAVKLTVSSVPGVTTKFPINEFSEILAANKEFKSGILSVSEEGLLKIEFEDEEDVKATYLLVGKE